MLELFQTADSIILCVLIFVTLIMLWMLSLLERRIRLLEERTDSLDRETGQLEEGLELLGTKTNCEQPRALSSSNEQVSAN